MESRTSTINPRRILIISQDVVGSKMAGPGIRYWEMARVLAREFEVTLVAPKPIDRAPEGVAIGSYQWSDASSLNRWLKQADAVIANGYVLMGHPELAHIDQLLTLDLYDPFLLENLEYMRSAPEDERNAQYRQDLALWNLQLVAGDFYLCATERQRDLYIGALTTAGRVTPYATDNDPMLRALIEVAPFGAPPESPIKRRPVLRDVVPGIGSGDAILLWTGGLWDWLDPLTLIQAMPQVIEHQPRARLVFLAGRHPGDVPAMRVADEAKAQAETLGLLDRYIFFYEKWVPYEERADVLLEADIAVSLHRNHLETAYAAVRSRFLDHLWAGLPSIVSDGDAAADLVRSHELGIVVPIEDVDALAGTIVSMLENPSMMQQYAGRARALASQWRWDKTLSPLINWLRVAPALRKERLMKVAWKQDANEPLQVGPPPLPLDSFKELIAQLEHIWQGQHSVTSGTALPSRGRQLVLSLAREASGSAYAQQTEFNTRMIHALYWLIEAMHNVEAQRKLLIETFMTLKDLRGSVDDMALAQHQFEERLSLVPRLQEGLSLIHERLSDEEMNTTVIAQHISRLLRE